MEWEVQSCIPSTILDPSRKDELRALRREKNKTLMKSSNFFLSERLTGNSGWSRREAGIYIRIYIKKGAETYGAQTWRLM